VERHDYIDPELQPDSLRRLTLNPKASRAIAQGKGVNLSLPPLPLTPPVRAQIVSEEGQCWEASFSNPLLNDTTTFKAKPD
jgi:hypothetical protein